MANKAKKVENFNPELLRLFRAGFDRQITISMQEKDGAAFVYRMNRLRQAMRNENHHLLSVAEGVEVSYDKYKKEAIVKPADSRYLDKIREALANVDIKSAKVAGTITGKEREQEPEGDFTLSQEEALKKFLDEGNGDG